MFRNLYFQSPPFRNFNFTDCLERIEPVSERSLLRDIRVAYGSGDVDPCFVDTVELSLRLETARRFLDHVSLPLEPRDFLLSKLFQFLYVPLTIQNQLDHPDALPLRRQLELWLDNLPESVVARLYRFDWTSFFFDSNRLDRGKLLARLDRYLPPLRRKRRRQAWMGRRGPAPDVAGYNAIRRAVRAAGKNWRLRAGLKRVAETLDGWEVPTPDSWTKLDPPATTWRSAVESHTKLVRKILEYRLERLKVLAERYQSLRGKDDGD